MESIDSSIGVTLTINGITCNDGNSKISKLSLEESISGEFPLLQIAVLLRHEFLSAPISDGSPVVLLINYPEYVVKSKDYKLMRFRVYYFEGHEVSNEAGLQYIISCMPEAYYKLNSISDLVFKGSSSSVFSGVAKELGIDTNLCNTFDTQVWFSLDGNRISFLRHTCLHSWVDNLSVMCWWVNRYGILYLKNFTDEIKRETTWKFFHNRNDDADRSQSIVFINSPRYISVSGENNTKEGYGKLNLVFSPQDNDISTLKVNKLYSAAESVNVNKDIVQPMRYDSLGIKTTNVHQNYFEAEEQNQRGRTLYSMIVECFSNEAKDVLLGDTVFYEMKLGGEVEGLMYTGKYIVIGIETIFSARSTVTKYTLARQGISIKANGTN